MANASFEGAREAESIRDKFINHSTKQKAKHIPAIRPSEDCGEEGELKNEPNQKDHKGQKQNLNEVLSKRPASAVSHLTAASALAHPQAAQLAITKDDLIFKKYV